MYVFLQYFDTVGWVFWPVKTVAGITYTVLVETLNPAQSINQSLLRVVISMVHLEYKVSTYAYAFLYTSSTNVCLSIYNL